MKRHRARLVDTEAIGLEMKGRNGGAGHAIDTVAVIEHGVTTALFIVEERGAKRSGLKRSGLRAIHGRRHLYVHVIQWGDKRWAFRALLDNPSQGGISASIFFTRANKKALLLLICFFFCFFLF